MYQVFSQQYDILSCDSDAFGRLKTEAMFRMAQETATSHTIALNVGREQTLKGGAVWVLSRTKLEIVRTPRYGERVSLSTWPGATQRTIFPRYYLMKNEKGETLISGSSLWLLMDAKTRRMATPAAVGINVEGICTGDEIPLPDKLRLSGLESSVQRVAGFSELDINGHVNNTKYLAWADDILPLSFHKENEPAVIQINFVSEIPCGANVTLNYAMTDGTLALRGIRGDGAETFELKTQYRPAANA